MVGQNVRSWAKRILRRLYIDWHYQAMRYYSRDIDGELQRRATAETADYIKKNLWEVPVFEDILDYYKYCVKQTTVEGLVFEFGVERGYTITMLAKILDNTIYGFDSFEGLPEIWLGPQMDVGTFMTDGPPSNLPQNVELVVGLFADTMPGFMAAHEGPVNLAHLDADLYSSTMCVFDNIFDRMVPGTILMFDEYYNYPNWSKDGEFRAFQEMVRNKNTKYEYIAHMRGTHRRVAVRITS